MLHEHEGITHINIEGKCVQFEICASHAMLALVKGEKNGLVCAYALLHQTGMIKQVSTTQKYVKLIPWYMNRLFHLSAYALLHQTGMIKQVSTTQ